MHEELVNRLRTTYEADVFINHGILLEAADAIEELSKKYLASEVDNTNLTGWFAEEHAKHLWIPVTERLPERGKYLCLGSLTYPYYRILSFTHDLESVDDFDFKGEKRSGWYWYDSEYGYCEAKNITHWMPLPKPPEDGEA